MCDTNFRYLLEFRIRGEVDWRAGSSFRNLSYAKRCVDATLNHVQSILEGRVFDWKFMAYRYYRGTYLFKP